MCNFSTCRCKKSGEICRCFLAISVGLAEASGTFFELAASELLGRGKFQKYTECYQQKSRTADNSHRII